MRYSLFETKLDRVLVESIGDEFYPEPLQSDDFPETDEGELSGNLVNTVRFFARAITYPIYGPVVYLIDKFVPTALLSELVRVIRMHGDTIIGDLQTQRKLQKAIRQAVFERERAINQDKIKDIEAGKHDSALGDLKHGGWRTLAGLGSSSPLYDFYR